MNALSNILRRVFTSTSAWDRILVIIGLARYIQRSIGLFCSDSPFDIAINLAGVQAFQRGLPLYAWPASTEARPLFASFVSSPVVAVLLFPLANLSLFHAVLYFRLFSSALYLFSLFILFRANAFEVRSTSSPLAHGGIFWLVALTWEPTFDSVGLGQLDEIILFCLALAYWGWIRGNDWVAGLGVGLAVAIKLTPILVVGYWLLKRRWRPVGVALGTACILGVLSCHVVSWQQCMIFAFSILPAVSRGSPYYYNQSFNGFWSRTCSTVKDWPGLEIASDAPVVRALALITGLILIVVVLWVLNRSRWLCSKRPDELAIEFGICLAMVLLITPIAWRHYFVWLVVALAAVFRRDALACVKRPHRRGVVLGVIGAVLLLNLSPNWLMRNVLHIAEYSVFLANLWVSLGMVGVILLLIVQIRILKTLRSPVA